MNPERTCPDCGKALPADAPRGLCPQCLMGAALSGRSSGGSATSLGFTPAGTGVLDTIAQSVGTVPRVLLCDTGPGEEPGPIVRKPGADDADTSTRYRIDGEIARGGMGAVLKGRDPDLGRDVALKVLREDLRENADMVRRFVEEAQIGGQLQHPGVVPIYELGTFADRRPFFAMKLVKGRTLAQLVADRKGPAADLPRFLSIFEAVCQTMAYAHARGVIHRDLKPSNVMVGSFGEVQVMDWGLAKILPKGGVADDAQAGKTERMETVIATARSGSDEPGLSHAGSIMGTPPYMAPEQARGEINVIDQRADVFALGSILAEILTGEPAFTGRTSAEIQRKAALGDNADALARLEVCGADAELITLAKDCLARERDDRPRDASAVAKRITAYLASVQERLRRAELTSLEERTRRRLTTVVAASVLAVMAVGGGGWLWVKSDRDARAVALTRDVNDALNKATVLRAQASSATTGAALLFAQAREQAQRALALVENGPAEPALKAQVTRLQADLDEEEKDRRLVTALDEARLAQAETVAGESRFASERAMPLFQQAFRAYGLPVAEVEPKVAAERIGQRPAATREAIVAALDEWDALASNKEYGVPVPHREWLRAVLEAAEPAEGWTRQLRAAREEKEETRRKTALEKLATADDVGTLPARALTRLAGQLGNVKAHASAAHLLRRAQQQHPADFWANNDLGTMVLKVTPPERDEAVRFLTAAVALRPQSPGAHVNLGHALEETGQLDAAIACYKKAIELDPKLALAHNNLGNALRDKGQSDAAIACYKKAIELDPKVAGAHNNLGLVLKDKGQLDAAIACYKKAIELVPEFAVPHNNLGLVLKDKGQLDAAIACYKKAIELGPKFAMPHYNLGLVLKDKGQLDAAIASYKKAIELDPKHAAAHYNLGVTLHEKGRLDAAIASYKKAIELDPKHAAAHYSLGNALKANGKRDDAIAEYRKAARLDAEWGHVGLAVGALGSILKELGRPDETVAIYRQVLEKSPRDAPAHVNLGHALGETGQLDAAIASYKKAIELDPKLAMPHYNLGVTLHEKGRLDAAIASYKKAIELDPKHAAAHYSLGNALKDKGQIDAAIASYKKAIELDPKLAVAHYYLGNVLKANGKRDDAIADYRKAARLDAEWGHVDLAVGALGSILKELGRPDETVAIYRQVLEKSPRDAPAHVNLGHALGETGQLDAAIASYKTAIELDPKYALAHNGLGNALRNKGQLDAAIACYKKAIELDPKFAMPHYNLGVTLHEKGRLDAAIASYKKAIELDPKHAAAHYSLGNALKDKGQIDAAIASYKKAIELDPKHAVAHYYLGNALKANGKRDDAIAEYRKAARLDAEWGHVGLAVGALGSILKELGRPDETVAIYRQVLEKSPRDAPAHVNLGHALGETGQLDAAIASYKTAIELDPKYARARTELANAERLAGAQQNLPSLLKGVFKPTTSEERLGLIELCTIKKLYRTSAGLYADAFATDPKLADDLQGFYRYSAACDAALAAAGQGEDAPKLDETEKARLRKQALDWLRADLAARIKQVEGGSAADFGKLLRHLKHSQKDSDLAGIRDATALAKLPADERAACEKLWSDVASLLKKVDERAR